MRNMWYIVKWQETEDGVTIPAEESCTIRTEEGDGLDTILNEIAKGVAENTLEVTMVQDDGEED